MKEITKTCNDCKNKKTCMIYTLLMQQPIISDKEPVYNAVAENCILYLASLKS